MTYVVVSTFWYKFVIANLCIFIGAGVNYSVAALIACYFYYQLIDLYVLKKKFEREVKEKESMMTALKAQHEQAQAAYERGEAPGNPFNSGLN